MSNSVKPYSFAAILLLTLPAMAHHSPAQFDLTQDVVIEGTIADVSWRNPHVYLELDITGADGNTVRQQIEAGPASNLIPLGYTADSLRVGDRVSVQVKPNKRGEGRTVLGWLLTRADGTAIPLHVRAIPPTAPGEAEASSLAGTWIPQGTGFTELAVAARSWPLTETGRAAVESTREARNASRSACIPFGPPALMLLPSAVIIELSDDELIFRLDVIDTERIVHLNQAEHPRQPEPSVHGHSIAHWDGDTLVIDTVGYRAHPDGYAFDLPSSASKHIVERLRLAADRKHIEYEAVVEDPEYLESAVTQRALWDYRPDQTPANLPCDPDVAEKFTEDL